LPTTARFLTEDSYTGERNDPLSLNRYTYCVNNPMKYYDPSGHSFTSVLNDVTDTITDFGNGMRNGVVEAFSWGVSDYIIPDNYQSDNGYVYYIGKATGNAAAEVVGAIITGGSGVAGAGVAVTSAGSLAPVAIPAAGAGIGYGLTVIASGAEKSKENSEKAKSERGKGSSSSGNSSEGTGQSSHLSRQQMNQYKNKVLSGEDIHFDTKEQAVEFIEQKFSYFKQEVSGSRSAEGWHYDSHPVGGSENPIEHINLYSKEQGFRVHITWGN